MGYNSSRIENAFLLECTKLRRNSCCAFSGVALNNQDGSTITWPFASGNRKEKYKYITVRYGKGIAGKVIATNSNMEIKRFPSDIIGKPTEYPIMLAEKLITAFALPLLLNGIPKGALLIGYRGPYDFTEDDYNEVKQTKHQLEELLPIYFTQ